MVTTRWVRFEHSWADNPTVATSGDVNVTRGWISVSTFRRSPSAAFAATMPPLTPRQRDKPLTIEQLIYCTLICYPIYRLPEGYGLAQPEQVIDYLYPSKDGHNPVKYSNISHSTNNTKSSFVASLTSNVLSPAKRQANTRFMQLRHRWQQLHKRQS